MVRSLIDDVESQMQSPLVKRIKSLLWHAVMMAFAFGISYLASHLTSLQMPLYVTTGLGLVLGQLSKYLNTQAGMLQ